VDPKPATVIACNVLGAISFSAQWRYANLCGYVDEQAAYGGALGRALVTDYCR
jgi:hypothetical protein